MQSTQATIVALAPKRRALRAGSRRRVAARGIVAVWIGIGALALVLLVGQATVLVMRHGLAGLGIALAVVSVAGWPIAGRLLKTQNSGPRKRPISASGGQKLLKLSARSADGIEKH